MISPGYSFCIITNGKRPDKLRLVLDSIRALGIESCEILISGEPPPGLDGVAIIPAVDAARGGRLGEMRNLLTAQARYDHLIVCDDDIIFHSDFYSGLKSFGEDYDVLCPRILNPDGTRFWDWATYGGVRHHILLEYGEDDPGIYVTGGFCIMKAYVAEKVKWDSVRGFYQLEDIDFSRRLKAAGFTIKHCPNATVTHHDARYTRFGRMVINTELLEGFGPLVPGILGCGFFISNKEVWAARDLQLLFPSSLLSQPSRLDLELQAAQTERYEHWPLEVCVYADHEPWKTLLFTKSGEKKKISLEISARTHGFYLRLHSSSVCTKQLQMGLRETALQVCALDLRREEPRGPSASADRKPPKVCWISPLLDFSGEALVSRRVVEGLERLGTDVKVVPASSDAGFLADLSADPQQAAAWDRRRAAPAENRKTVVFAPLGNCCSSILTSRAAGGTEHGLTAFAMWGGSKLPASWSAALSQADEIWVPNAFGRRIAVEAGLPAERVHLVPLGVDTGYFDPARWQPRADLGGKRFNFLSVFRWEKRKGWDILLRAYAHAFKPDDDVSLTLRTYAPGVSAADIADELTAFIEGAGLHMEDLAPINLFADFIPESSFPSLYRSAQAFVLPSRGEACGLPYLEAIAMGLPVIATRWGGPLDYLTDDNAYLIPAGEPKPLAECCQGMEESDAAKITWADPGWEDTAELMRRVYEDPSAAKTRAFRAAAALREGLTINHTLAAVYERLSAPDVSPAASLPAVPSVRGACRTGSAAGNPIVGIDARPLLFTDPAFSCSGRFIVEHLQAVMRRTPDWHYVLYTEENRPHERLDSLAGLPNVSCAPLRCAQHDGLALFYAPHALAMEPGFDSPFRIAPHNVPLCTFVFDLLRLVERGFYLESMGSLEQSAYLSRLEQLRSSPAHICTSWQHNRNDLQSCLGIPGDRISVLRCPPPATTPPQAKLISPEETRKRLGLGSPYFLAVGSMAPHKNFALTLHTMAGLMNSVPIELIVAGDARSRFAERYCRIVEENKLSSIRFIGWVEREELENLYSMAAALIHPSRAEGMAGPVLEAMACSCPVVGSKVPGMLEPLGEAGISVSHHSLEELAAAMIGLLRDPNTRAERTALGRRHAGQFTWETTAGNTIALWERLMSSGRRPV